MPIECDKSPRLQVLDTGLLNFFAGVQKDVFASRDLTNVYQGRIIEHITGQDLTSNNDEMFRNLLFWVRDKEGTTSELAVSLYAGHFQIDHLKTPSSHSFRLMNLPYYLAGKLKDYVGL